MECFDPVCAVSRVVFEMPYDIGPLYLRWVTLGRGDSRAVPWSSYDLAERKWIRMPPFEFSLLKRTSGWYLVAAGGLVCFRSADGGRILVCNPLTNRWKELPSGRLYCRLRIISCMIMDEHRTSYKILFAGNAAHKRRDPRYGTVDLYDSMTITWSVVQNISVGTVVECGAYCGGEFYGLTRQSRNGPYAVVILYMTTLRWREESIPIPERLSRSPFIVACLGGYTWWVECMIQSGTPIQALLFSS